MYSQAGRCSHCRVHRLLRRREREQVTGSWAQAEDVVAGALCRCVEGTHAGGAPRHSEAAT
jgi:hypothetical protein